MRVFVAIALVALAAMTAFADQDASSFDLAAWYAKRRLRDADATRLRTAYTNCVANLQTPAENVSISLETFPDGAMKTVVTAKRAQFFLDTGFVWAADVVLRKFKQDGTQDLRIDAEYCAIDREAKSGWADGATKIVQGSTVLSGSDVYFSSPENYVRIYRNADLESKNLKMGGFNP